MDARSSGRAVLTRSTGIRRPDDANPFPAIRKYPTYSPGKFVERWKSRNHSDSIHTLNFESFFRCLESTDAALALNSTEALCTYREALVQTISASE